MTWIVCGVIALQAVIHVFGVRFAERINLAAAKLRSAGSQEVSMFDQQDRPIAGWLERCYFGRGSRPEWHTVSDEITIMNDICVTGLQVGQTQRACDGVVMVGELVPNSELIVAAGLAMSRPGRIPDRLRRNELSAPGWFIAGGEVGGFHGADCCYQDGRRAGMTVATFLREASRCDG